MQVLVWARDCFGFTLFRGFLRIPFHVLMTGLLGIPAFRSASVTALGDDLYVLAISPLDAPFILSCLRVVRSGSFLFKSEIPPV